MLGLVFVIESQVKSFVEMGEGRMGSIASSSRRGKRIRFCMCLIANGFNMEWYEEKGASWSLNGLIWMNEVKLMGLLIGEGWRDDYVVEWRVCGYDGNWPSDGSGAGGWWGGGGKGKKWVEWWKMVFMRNPYLGPNHHYNCPSYIHLGQFLVVVEGRIAVHIDRR